MALSKAERAANRRYAAKHGYKDANGDGRPDVDPLDRQKLAEQYKAAVGLIYAVPEIRPIFETAVKQGWSVDKFTATVHSTDWYRNNNEYYRMAWAAESIGGADWLAKQQEAKIIVQNRATQLGASLSGGQADALARRYLYEGWGESSRASLLDKALSEDISYLPDERGKAGFKGEAGTFVDRLKNLAFANGVNYSDTWYQAAARAVASGLGTEDDYLREIRDQAASKWAPWGEKIKAGATAYDIASPYINEMADTLEISPTAVTLNDPYIQQAMMGMDEKGNPAPMSLWEFQKRLKNDPRWMNTNKAQNQVTGVADAVMKMFGLRG